MDSLTKIRDIAENFRMAANNSVRSVFANAPELPVLPEPPELPILGKPPMSISDLVSKLPKLPGAGEPVEELPEVELRALGAMPRGPKGISRAMALDVERPLLQRHRNMAMMV